MASAGQIKVTGIEHLIDRLQMVDLYMQGDILWHAMEAAGDVVRKEALIRLRPHMKNVKGSTKSRKWRVPSRDYVIVWRTDHKSRGKWNIAPELSSGGKNNKNVRRVLVGPPRSRWYLYYLEAGKHNQPARPWLRPAFDSVKDAAYEVMRSTLSRGIESAISSGKTMMREAA